MGMVARRAREREAAIAEKVLHAERLPDGIRSFRVEPGEDAHGDPVMFVWLVVNEPERRDRGHVERLTRFALSLRDKLYDRLEEHRPEVGFR